MNLLVPTSLSQEQIIEFQELYKKHYNIDLTNQKANEKSVRFLQFMTAIIENNKAFLDE